MRTKTIKRWAIFIASLSLIGGTGFIFQQFQVARLAKSVVERADNAAREGNLVEARELYAQHLALLPDDLDVKIKYADTLLKGRPTPRLQNEAFQIYYEILKANPGRTDVRRKQMALNIDLGRLREGAQADLNILLNMDENENDGDLQFLMGRCCEDGENYDDAVIWYQKAIENNAPQRIEAYHRRATLLRSELKKEKAADQVIEQMVQAAPESYRVYLERGRYRRRFHLPGSSADFQKALELAKDSPEVYIELGKAMEAESGYEQARKILTAGLEKVPASVEIYEALTNLELGSGHTDQAVENLERGLKTSAVKGKGNLRWILANVLAIRGDTGKLLLQIEELKKIGFSGSYINLLKAYYYINASDFQKARQILVPLDSNSSAKLGSDFKVRVNNMLARCYSQLGEPGMQQEAYLRALRANPEDVTAKLGLIARMVSQGELDGAINEYRTLVKTQPKVKLPLAQLLIARNRQRVAPQREWSEAKSLIDDAEKASPESVEPTVTRAEYYIAQDKFTEAQDELARAKLRFPKSVGIWSAQAALLGVQKRFDEAEQLLDQAQKVVGDCVELRLRHAKLLAAKGGPEVFKDLNKLAESIESFTKDDRRKLLSGLALEFQGLQDSQNAMRVWSKLAEQERSDVEVRLTLLDLAFQTADSDAIDKTIKEIREIEGTVGLMGRYCQVRYLIWQAQRVRAKAPLEALRIRTEARTLLNELASRRPDWSVVPLAFAQMEQQEEYQDQNRLTDAEIRTKEENIISFYLRAIDLGQRSSAIVRETVKLLFKNKRGSEALDLLNKIPVESQLSADLGRQASKFAVESRDFERAKEIARKMVAANPGDFQERIWLVQVLLSTGRPGEAETELLRAIDAEKSDPDRWITLVQFMVLTKQIEKAERAIQDAEAALPPAQAALALAQCCEMIGRAYDNDDEAMKRWYTKGAEWYEKAKVAHPDDISIVRRLTDFYRRTKQMAAAEAQLTGILKQDSSSPGEQKAWARQTLALILAASSDERERVRALSLLEGENLADGREDPEQLRVLAQVLDAQATVEHRKRAIEILESLVTKNLANADDRFLLAGLQERSGDWPEARATYRDLNLRTKSARELETLNRRPQYLSQFVTSLLRNHKTGNDQELAEAQDLVDELKQLQPDQLGTLVLQIQVHQARNELDRALDLIQSSAKRANLTPLSVKVLAGLAESLGRPDIAGQLYSRYSSLADSQDGKHALAMFLGRRGDIKGALDVCEPLWADLPNVELAAKISISVVLSNPACDVQQLNRVTKWLEQAIKQKTDSPFLQVALGNCRERQARYDEAESLYENVIKQSAATSTVSSPSAKGLIATSYNNLAWLLSLKDNKNNEALVDVDSAIRLAGPLPDYLDTRGVIELNLKQTQDAIKDLETAVKADPAPARLFHLSQAYLQANDREKARQYWKDAKSKNLETGSISGSLHPLEQSAYQKLVKELGSP
jgi:tetratricopeptide (TPR) repeat protein